MKNAEAKGNSTNEGLPFFKFHIPSVNWCKLTMKPDGDLHLFSGETVNFSKYKNFVAAGFKIPSGTSTQALMADGSNKNLSHLFNAGLEEVMCMYYDDPIDSITYIETYDGLNIVDLVYEWNDQKYHTAFMWLGSYTASNIGSNGGNVIIFEKGKFNDITSYIPSSDGDGGILCKDSCYFKLTGCRLSSDVNILTSKQYIIFPKLFNEFNNQ